MNQTLKKGAMMVLKVMGTFVVTSLGTYTGNLLWERTKEPLCRGIDDVVDILFPKKKENEVQPKDTESNEQSN